MKNTQQNETIRRYGCTLRIYDNGGRSMDRYTMIPPRWSAKAWRQGRSWSCLFSGLDPRGMSGHGMADPGPLLGKRIKWSDLPAAVQRLARAEWPVFCPAKKTAYITHGIGRSKYVINYHDGIKCHDDGSPFFDVRTFTNQEKANIFYKQLADAGYTA